MTAQSKQFVVALNTPGTFFAALPAAAPSSTNEYTFVFKNGQRVGPPFAWINSTNSGNSYVPPLARMASKLLLTDEDMLQSVLSDNVEERLKAPPRRGHSDEWYQERRIFCADCKCTVNSQVHKRGSRCHGCRRWFHNTCPGTDQPSSSKQQQAVAPVPAAAAAAAGVEEGNKSEDHHHNSHSLFFHTDECNQVYSKLAAVAAAGEQQLSQPAKGGGFWQQQQKQAEVPPETWRLLDLAEVRRLYKDAQRRGTLMRQHQRVVQQLAGDERQVRQQQQEEEEAKKARSWFFGCPSKKQAEATTGASVAKAAVPTRLDDFLVVSELLKGLGDTPKDLLEDSFAVISRSSKGGPATCVATFNLFGRHARLQGLVTPAWRARHGHATMLIRQLESVLADAGLQQLVAILEQQDVEGGLDIERWMRRSLGFKPASSEQHMIWRRELPEYHKTLTAGCTLLVKPLTDPKARSGRR